MAHRKTKHRDPIVRLFAARLREARVRRGLTQADPAAAAAVSVTHVSDLEGGMAAPGIDLVARLAAALGVGVGDLLPAAGPPDDADELRARVRGQADRLLEAADREALLTLAPILALLFEATARRKPPAAGASSG